MKFPNEGRLENKWLFWAVRTTTTFYFCFHSIQKKREKKTPDKVWICVFCPYIGFVKDKLPRWLSVQTQKFWSCSTWFAPPKTTISFFTLLLSNNMNIIYMHWYCKTNRERWQKKTLEIIRQNAVFGTLSTLFHTGAPSRWDQSYKHPLQNINFNLLGM